MSNLTKKKHLIICYVIIACIVVGVAFINTNQSFAAIKLKKPIITVAKAIDANTSKIKWKRVKSAKKYQLFASFNGGQYKKVITTKKLQYTHKKLKAGNKYSYKIRAVRGKVKSPFSKVKKVKLPKQMKINKKTATVYLNKSIRLRINNNLGKSIKWNTNNNNIATVSSTGLVKGKKVGTAIIRAKVSKKTFKCKVTVKRLPTISKKEAILYAGDRVNLFVKNPNGKTVWATSNETVASVSNGVVVGKRRGTTIITAKNGGRKLKCEIVVRFTKEQNLDYLINYLKKNGKREDNGSYQIKREQEKNGVGWYDYIKLLKNGKEVQFHTLINSGYKDGMHRSITLDIKKDSMNDEEMLAGYYVTQYCNGYPSLYMMTADYEASFCGNDYVPGEHLEWTLEGSTGYRKGKYWFEFGSGDFHQYGWESHEKFNDCYYRWDSFLEKKANITLNDFFHTVYSGVKIKKMHYGYGENGLLSWEIIDPNRLTDNYCIEIWAGDSNGTQKRISKTIDGDSKCFNLGYEYGKDGYLLESDWSSVLMNVRVCIIPRDKKNRHLAAGVMEVSPGHEWVDSEQQHFISIENVSFENGVLSWDYADGATDYCVYIYKGELDASIWPSDADPIYTYETENSQIDLKDHLKDGEKYSFAIWPIDKTGEKNYWYITTVAVPYIVSDVVYS